MNKKTPSRGICKYCGYESTKAGLTKHFYKCEKLKDILSDNVKKKYPEIIYHLHIEDAYNKDYWLRLEMSGSAKLIKLDEYLREIWLECCDHLSEFSIGRWTGDTISMNNKADSVFEQGLELYHMYDFGTTSETKIRVLSSRIGNALTKYPIALLARNKAPEYECIECDSKSNWLCFECLIEDNVFGTFCDKHIEQHPHEEYGEPIPLVNSPRLGRCGYVGPANPPY